MALRRLTLALLIKYMQICTHDGFNCKPLRADELTAEYYLFCCTSPYKSIARCGVAIRAVRHGGTRRLCTDTKFHSLAGRRTWLRHIFPRRNGLFIKWNKAERARLAPGTSTPPSRSCPSPHFGARFDPSLVSHHLSWPGARRSLARSFIAHGPDGPVARH